MALARRNKLQDTTGRTSESRAELHSASSFSNTPAWKQRVSCEQCGMRMLRKTLNRHLHSRHGFETLHCEYCGVNFKRQDHLRRHIQEQHRLQLELVECMYCGKAIRPRYLNDHFKGQKCTRARIVASRSAKTSSCASTGALDVGYATSLLQTLGTESTIDPLVLCTRLFCWSWAMEREWINKDGGVCSMLSPFLHPAAPQSVGQIWKLRGLTLQQARRLIVVHSPMPILELARCLLSLCLLAWSDAALFGWGSSEYKAHWQGMCDFCAVWRRDKDHLHLDEYLTFNNIKLIALWIENVWDVFAPGSANGETYGHGEWTERFVFSNFPNTRYRVEIYFRRTPSGGVMVDTPKTIMDLLQKTSLH